MNRGVSAGWLPIATGVPGPGFGRTITREGFRNPDESYVRYMESWPDDDEGDLSRFWTFTAGTSASRASIGEPSAV